LRPSDHNSGQTKLGWLQEASRPVRARDALESRQTKGRQAVQLESQAATFNTRWVQDAVLGFGMDPSSFLDNRFY
jgi:hypothetical protein